MDNKSFLTVKKLADILGISRIAVFKKIKKGEIKAIRIGKIYAIPKKELGIITGTTLTDKDKTIIDRAVKKTVSEYGETLRLLGRD